MHKVIYPLITAVGFGAIMLFYYAGQGYESGLFQLDQATLLKAYGAYAGIAGAGLSIFYILWQRPMGTRLGLIFVSAMLGITTFYLQQVEAQLQQALSFEGAAVSAPLAQMPQLVALGRQV